MTEPDHPGTGDDPAIAEERGDGVSELPLCVLTSQGVDELADMLTVIMGNVEQLAMQSLTQRGCQQLSRSATAVDRAGRLLWHALGTSAAAEASGSSPHVR